jgi:hypothetical protein
MSIDSIIAEPGKAALDEGAQPLRAMFESGREKKAQP